MMQTNGMCKDKSISQVKASFFVVFGRVGIVGGVGGGQLQHDVPGCADVARVRK